MVNRVSTRDKLDQDVNSIARDISEMPRLGLALTKQVINHIEDLQGKRSGMDAAFAWHHFTHAHNELVSGDKLGGQTVKSMSEKNKY